MEIEPEDCCSGTEMDRWRQLRMVIELANYYSVTAPVDHLKMIVREGHSDMALA